MSKLERDFQSDLIDELNEIYPEKKGNFITKFEPRQGVPDILILHDNKWALLECKKSKDEPRQPNQDFYVEKFNNMSFSRFIYPENKEEVLNELQSALSP